jgi:hypothetical protein
MRQCVFSDIYCIPGLENAGQIAPDQNDADGLRSTGHIRRETQLISNQFQQTLTCPDPSAAITRRAVPAAQRKHWTKNYQIIHLGRIRIGTPI